MADHVVIFGAGAIGRGLMADLVMQGGLVPVFVEADADWVRVLHKAETYTIRLVGAGREEHRITDYDILTTDQTAGISQALEDCCFAVTNVGGRNLQALAVMIAPGLQRRNKPLNLLVCENWPHCDSVLAKAIALEGVSQGFAAIRCSVERMVRRSETTLDLIGEFGQSLFVDAGAWMGEPPSVEGMNFTSVIDAYYTRKLYTNNAGHALLAYEGHLAGCAFIHEALTVPWIRRDLDELLRVAAQVMVLHFRFDPAEMDQHIHDLLHWRFANCELADPIARVAREPLRKLGPEERLVGLARLLTEYNLSTKSVARAVAAAMCYQNQDDPESLQLAKEIQSQGPAVVLQRRSRLRETDTCFTESLDAYKQYAREIVETRKDT